MIVKAEVSLEAFSDCFEQMDDWDIDTLAKWMVEDTPSEALKLQLAIERYFKEFA